MPTWTSKGYSGHQPARQISLILALMSDRRLIFWLSFSHWRTSMLLNRIRAAFNSLTTTHSELRNVTCNNFALGSDAGTQPFFANSNSDMSSFLPLGPSGWGQIIDRPTINVSTVDAYCSEHGIQIVDLLKSDTQGFELEVLKGGKHMLNERRVRLIYLEIIFSKMYENLPRLDEIYNFLADHSFDLYAFYKFYFQHNRASWTDALFIRSEEA